MLSKQTKFIQSLVSRFWRIIHLCHNLLLMAHYRFIIRILKWRTS